MSDGSAEIQIAIYDILNSLSPPLGEGVYAPAKQNQKLPYVEIGESDTVAVDVQCRDGLEEAVTIHVWAAPSDQTAPKGLMSRIREALHGADLMAAGRSYAHCSVRSTRLFPDLDGKALHGVMTVRINHFGQ